MLETEPVLTQPQPQNMSEQPDFDRIHQRRGTGSIKWDRFPGLTPYWVADMDFQSPQCIIDALTQRVEHGIFGYANAHKGLVAAISDYLERQHHHQLDPDSLIHLPGLVPALSLACRAFLEADQEVMICSPVYYPFHKVHRDAKARLIDVPHIRKQDRWEFDWEKMENAVTTKTRLFILCNPQNPLGRVFSREEILNIVDFCQRHQLVLISDEIHCDLILEPELQHSSILSLAPEMRRHAIALMAPSKTYNIAGLGYAFAVIEDSSLRQRFNQAIGCTLPEINALAMFAAEAAYQQGEPWRQQLLSYLRNNRDTLFQFISEEIPEIRIFEHHATYLYWLDCSHLKLSNPAKFFADNANIYLTDGRPFGSSQHVRFNFGCPTQLMLDGLTAMKQAINSR